MAHVLDLTHIMLWAIEKQTKMYKQISGNNMVLVNLIYSSFFLNKYIVHTLELQIFKLQKKTTNIWVYEMPLSYPKRCDFFIDKWLCVLMIIRQYFLGTCEPKRRSHLRMYWQELYLWRLHCYLHELHTHPQWDLGSIKKSQE